MQNAIRASIQKDICVAYQPIIDLKNGNVLGYEALLRNHDKIPEELIKTAHEQGDLLELEMMICQKIAYTFNGIKDNTIIFINLTPFSFAYKEGLAIMKSLSLLDPRKVVIELTEQTKIPQNISDIGRYWREKGYRLAVDDISQGFSRLSLVAIINPDYIKIDKTCISGALTSHGWKQVLKSIVNMAKSINSKTIGEGIETEKEKELLLSYGIDYGQGYYFGKPKITL